MVGWHRPGFSTNRLGGPVGQILSTAPVDVAVFVERGGERLETLLVPYSANIHDELALELAIRLLVSGDTRRLTVLQVVQAGQVQSELTYEFSTLMQQLPAGVRDRIDVQTLEAPEPIQAVVEASAAVDLTIAGTSRAWGIERQTLGRYTDQLAIQCQSSLLITRRYSQVTSHLASVLAEKQSAAS
jgi:nucleotide-binding universal stress UspA family protein